MNYRIVEHFRRSDMGDGPCITVMLREWVPEGLPAGGGHCMACGWLGKHNIPTAQLQDDA